MKNPINKQLGENIRKFRRERNLTQAQLAAMLDNPISSQQLAKYELGYNTISACILFDITVKLQIKIYDLFEGLIDHLHPQGENEESVRIALANLTEAINTHIAATAKSSMPRA